MNNLYREGKFIGDTDSTAHALHIAITAFLDRENSEDAQTAINDFRVVAGEDREIAEIVINQYPLASCVDGEAIRQAFLDECNDVWRNDSPASSGRQARHYLTTNDFTATANHGPGYVIKGLLSKRSYAVMYGAPGEGKTFVALDIAYAVAQNRDWFGHKTRGGIVLYVPFEGGGGVIKRVQALIKTYGHASQFRVIENPDYNLRERSGREAFGSDMAAALGKEKPVLIVLDTLARSLKGGDENSAKDIGALNDAVGALIENTGACVVVIHHSGKNKDAGARGSSALLGAVDTEIQIDGNRIISSKQRDIDLAAPIGFKLTPVIVGTDDDGDELTSCVVESEAIDSRKHWKPTGRVLDAWNALCEVSPNNAPISSPEWRAAFARKAYPVEEPATGALKKAYQRAVKCLAEAGWVIETNVGWQRPLTGGVAAEKLA